jgi:hypothetical protein
MTTTHLLSRGYGGFKGYKLAAVDRAATKTFMREGTDRKNTGQKVTNGGEKEHGKM